MHLRGLLGPNCYEFDPYVSLYNVRSYSYKFLRFYMLDL